MDTFAKKLEDISALESVHSHLTVCDSNGTLTYVSDSAFEMYGVEPSEMLGKTVFELEETGVFSPSVSVLALKSGAAVTSVQVLPSGQSILISAHPMLDNYGNVEGVISFPWQMEDVVALEGHFDSLRRHHQQDQQGMSFIFQSPQMDRVLKLASKVARFEVTLLFTGETGVGKTSLARFVHANSSCSSGPFVEVNCATLPQSLIESELFGYEAGAFTGARAKGKQGHVEAADGGTLFLDEIGELPLDMQSSLLSVLQDKSFYRVGGTRKVQSNFRLIAATNCDLEELVKKGVFRSDLYFRINVVNITIPPLRTRPEDIRHLIDVFQEKVQRELGVSLSLSEKAKREFVRQEWPGNIRELQNAVYRRALAFDGDESGEECDDLFFNDSDSIMFEVPKDATWKAAKEILERQLITRSYAEYGTTVGVAKALGISQSSAAQKIRRYLGGSKR